jgi:CBS domain-containing protein
MAARGGPGARRTSARPAQWIVLDGTILGWHDDPVGSRNGAELPLTGWRRLVTLISAILERKGNDVVTIGPGRTLLDAARTLEEFGIGSLVVSRDGQSVDGILSERDIVRRVATRGAAALDDEVSTAMTREVVTCDRQTSVDDLMTTMTERRMRHIPVLVEGRLVGIVSIGDVVKSRIVELEVEREALESYVSQGR